MAEFLTTRGASSQIEDIIRNAKKDLYLVSPYLKLSKTFLTRLKDASDNGVRIRVIYGKDELKATEKEGLKSIKNLELYFCENLHAKCYFNELLMVIASMNMYEYSELNNQEMGVLIRYPADRKLFEDAKREALTFL